MTYDRAIYLLTQVDTRNAFNEKVKDTYDIYGFRFAMATFNGGSENLQAKQLVGNSTVVFTIPWEPNITQSMVIKYDGKYYDIQSTAEEGRGFRLHLTCNARDRNDPVIIND